MKIFIGILITLLIVLSFPYLYKILQLKTLSKSDLPKEGGWATLSSGNIYYQWHEPTKKLNDEVVILVHGFSTPSFVWNGLLLDLLESGFRVLVFDHYGRGYSERPSTNYDKEFYVTELNDLVNHQNILKPFHLVGYSMGGVIVSFYADQYPKKVRSLSLIAPAGFSDPVVIPKLNNLMYYPIIGEWFFNVFNYRFQNLLMPETEKSNDERSISQKEYKRLFQEQFKYRGCIESLLSTIRNFDMFSTLEMDTRLGERDNPVLVIWGKQDGVVSFSGTENLKKVLPQAELVSIEDGTHDITFRRPTKVGKVLSKFIQQN